MSLAPHDPVSGKDRTTSSERSSTDPAPEKRRCIVILGMHRSGTSALTRVVNLLGADISRGLIPPKPSNVTGFWESQSIFQIHNELLREFNLLWHDYLPLPLRWEKTEAAKEARGRLVEYLRSEFSESPLFTIKDPRICRLLPLWIEAFRELDVEPVFLFCHRSPLEVAASLYSRDEIPWETSLLLWIRSYVEAEEATRGLNRLFVSYEDLIRDWRSVMAQITDTFDLQWPRPIDQAAPEIEDFLSDSHRHHTVMDFELVDDPETRELLRSMYQAIQEDAEDPEKGLHTFTTRAAGLLDRKSGIYAPVLKHERKTQFKLQTEKARAQRFNRRLQWKVKNLKRRGREEKRRLKLTMIGGIVAALAVGLVGGYLLANRSDSPPESTPSEERPE